MQQHACTGVIDDGARCCLLCCDLLFAPLGTTQQENMDAMACKALRATFKCHLKYVDLDVDKQSSEG
jgi:hypothetical protein